MSVSGEIRALARERLSTAEIARRLGIRYQHAYNVLKANGSRVTASKAVQDEAYLGLTQSVDFTDAISLVSCVSRKLSETAPARLLYCSEWFVKVRTFVEAHSTDWFILSALYGVVSPDSPIAPYEKTLNAAGVIERRAWTENVYRQLAPILLGRRRAL